MTRDVGCAAPGRLWQTRRGQREKKSSKERDERERREKEQLSSRKKHKRAKNGKRGKREKKTKVKEQTERKFSLLLCFFFVRESCSFSRLSSLRSLTRSSKKNRHFRRTVGKKRSTKHAKSNVSLISAGEGGRVIQMRRIGLGWLPGASIGVLSGFFIFNEPLREFHAVKEKKNTLKSTEKKNENNSRSEE